MKRVGPMSSLSNLNRPPVAAASPHLDQPLARWCFHGTLLCASSMAALHLAWSSAPAWLSCLGALGCATAALFTKGRLPEF